MKRAAVYLIGTGPGDPGLLTVYGLECLRSADVVVYDHRVPRRLLEGARAGAELIAVGTGGPKPIAQEAISYLLADKAREGRTVARLKWGDPFVFDRGGEEALYLHEQRVPFEVVPGLPAAVAVPAYAGVPVTYPGAGDTVTLLRGYEEEDRATPAVDWSSLAKLGGTVVCFAGAPQLPRILDSLRAHGWPAADKAAVVYDGTLPGQETLAGTIGELIDRLRQQPRRGPATLVVGRVVGLRPHLRWFDTRPLSGRRVLVTRPRDQAAELVTRLAALGADPIEAPLIRIEPAEDPAPLRAAAAASGAFDWIVFSSVNAVTSFMDAVFASGADVRALKGPRLCAIGSGTASALARYSIVVDLVPAEFRAEAVAEAIAPGGRAEGLRVLLPRADIGRETLAERLRAAGAAVTEVVAYRTVLDEPGPDRDPDVYRLLLEAQIDVVTFASPSAVRSFVRIYGAEPAADLLRNTAVAVIGPVTADTARQHGIPVTIEPNTYTIPALVDAIAAHYAGQTRPGMDPSRWHGGTTG